MDFMEVFQREYDKSAKYKYMYISVGMISWIPALQNERVGPNFLNFGATFQGIFTE